MPDTPKPAVFLSYTRDDTAAAQRLADALRAASIEVWFDQNELVGPCRLSPNEIRLDPLWSRLKDDPRFEEILRSAQPR